MKQEPKEGLWDYHGEFDPARGWHFTTFSVGIFQWVMRADGKGLKRGKVLERIRGYANNREDVYRRAQDKCDRLNAHDKDGQ